MPRTPWDEIGEPVKGKAAPWQDVEGPVAKAGPSTSWWDTMLLPDLSFGGTMKKGNTLDDVEFQKNYPKLDMVRRFAKEFGQGAYDSLIQPMSSPKNLAIEAATAAATGGLGNAAKGVTQAGARMLIGKTAAQALPKVIPTAISAASLPVAYDSAKAAYYNPNVANVSNAVLATAGTALAPLQFASNLGKVKPEIKTRIVPEAEVNLPPVAPINRQLGPGPEAPLSKIDPSFVVDEFGVAARPGDAGKLNRPPVIDAEIIQDVMPESRQLYPGKQVGTFVAGENGVEPVVPGNRQSRIISMVEDPGAKPLYHRSFEKDLEFKQDNNTSGSMQTASGTTHFSELPQTRESYGPYQTVRFSNSGNRFLDLSDGNLTPDIEAKFRKYLSDRGVGPDDIDYRIDDIKRQGEYRQLNTEPGANFAAGVQENIGDIIGPNQKRRSIDLEKRVIEYDKNTPFRDMAGERIDLILKERGYVDGFNDKNITTKDFNDAVAEAKRRTKDPAYNKTDPYNEPTTPGQEYDNLRHSGFKEFLVENGYDGVRYRGIDNDIQGVNEIGIGVTRPDMLSKERPSYPAFSRPVESTIGGLPNKGLQPFDPDFAKQQVASEMMGRFDDRPAFDVRTGRGRKKKAPPVSGIIDAEVIDEPTVASAKAETIDPTAGKASDEIPPSAGVKKDGSTGKFEETLPGDLKVNLNPDDARMDWVGGRAASSVYARRVAQQFEKYRELGKAGIDAFESGVKGFDDVRKHMDGMFKSAVKAGVDMGYRDNYLSHLFSDPPEKIQAVFDRIISDKPGFSKQRVFDSYKQAEAAGLTPKYDNLTDIVANYSERVYKAVADKKFVNDLVASETLSLKPKAGYVQLENFPVKGVNGRLTTFYAPDDLAKKINGYMKDADPSLKTVEAVAGFMKGLVLTGGVPNKAINSHAVSIAFRNAMFSENPLTGLKGAARYMFDPEKAGSYIDNNLQMAEEAAIHGMTLGGEKVNFSALGDEIRNTKLGDTKVGKALSGYTEWMQSTFEKPLFDKMLPALKLQKYAEFKDMLIADGLEPKQAMRTAADMSNKAFGGINWDMKGVSRQKQSLARTFLLAPDWLATQGYLAKDISGALLNPGTPVGKAYQMAAQNAMAMYLSAQYTNKATSGHWMHENDEGHQFQIELTGMPGVKEGKKFYLTPFNTGMDFAHIPFEIAQKIATAYSDPTMTNIGAAVQEPVSQIDRRLNPLVGIAGELKTNTDYRGNPIWSTTDRFGRPQNPLVSGGSWMASKALPPFAEGAIRRAQGKTGNLEAVAEMLELPLRGAYPKQPK